MPKIATLKVISNMPTELAHGTLTEIKQKESLADIFLCSTSLQTSPNFVEKAKHCSIGPNNNNTTQATIELDPKSL
jgi:galactitol-specific phosphotransferase system IIB component